MICSWVELLIQDYRLADRVIACDHPTAPAPRGRTALGCRAEQRREIQMTDDEGAIRVLIETWMKASQAGDIDTVLDLMTEDVVFMVPGREPFGKEAFANATR